MAPKLSKMGHRLDQGLPAAKTVGPTERDLRRRRYRLEQQVSGITKRNRHDEVNWGRRVGKEVWWGGASIRFLTVAVQWTSAEADATS
jgi:hypothetical protein